MSVAALGGSIISTGTRNPTPLALLIAALTWMPAEPLDLRTVMARAGAYVAKYQQDFSLLLADERYVQEVANATKAPTGDAW